MTSSARETDRRRRRAARALGTSRRTTRALGRGVRTRPGAANAGRRDVDLLALVEDPFTDVADARDRLQTLERTLYDRGDGRAAFLTVYARVTGEVERGIAEGAFADTNWVAAYLVAFADHYRRAFAAFERGDLGAVPDPWQLAFESALDEECLLVQKVLLGINAHVNYDLALALDDVGIDPDRDRKRADHRTINEVLASLVDEEQELLAERYAAGIGDLDESMGRLDEWLAMGSLREGRRLAWRGAVALSLGRHPRLQGTVRWVLNTVTLGVGYAILTPSKNRDLHDWLGKLEAGTG